METLLNINQTHTHFPITVLLLACLTSLEDDWDQTFEREVKLHSTLNQTELKQHCQNSQAQLDAI